jgi:hypothetical protein
MSEPKDEFGGRASNADRALDDWLQTARAHQAPPGLAAAIQLRVAALDTARASSDPLERVIAWLREQMWRPVAMAAVPLLLGVLAGWFIPQDDDTTALAQSLDRWSFADAAGEQDHDTLR